MPLYVRRLPGSAGFLIDPSTFPPGHAFYNPSFSFPTLYVRATRHETGGEFNYVVLHDLLTGKTAHVESPAKFLKPNVNMFQGIEDLRICWHQDRLWFTATSTHASYEMNNELLVGHFNKELTEVERLEVVDIGSLPVKNVCPFVHEDKLLLWDAFKKRVYHLVTEAGPEDTERSVAKPYRTLVSAPGVCFDKFRGSTSPVHLHGNTWGCVVHDIIFNDNTRLVTRLSYLHHWVEFDLETGTITFVSSPFWVVHWGIEYVSGLHYHRDTQEITLYVGVNDQKAMSHKTTLHDLRIGK